MQNKAIVFMWQKQSILKRRSNGSLIMPVGQKFRQNHSMSHCFRDTSIFCVLQFLQKIRKLKMAAIFEWTNFFLKTGLSRVTLRYQNFIEIALSSMVFEIQAFLCFAFLKKI